MRKQLLIAGSLCLLIVGCQGKPAATISGIEILGDAKFVAQVNQALAMIDAAAPRELDAIAKYVKRIKLHERSGMDTNQRLPTCQLAAATAYASVTWCAGVIAHEAHHSRLSRTPGHEYGLAEEEQACNLVQMRVMKAIGAPQHELDHLATQDGSHFDSNGDGRYTWDDYNDRNW